jgi:CheY-like chemotaxis protein
MMEEGKTLVNEVTAASYDAADRPFDFVGEGGLTALLCEPDPAARERIGESLKALGYQITTPGTIREALKAMRFHLFDLVVVNERFETVAPETNEVLTYLESLPMTTRRRFFVALLSDRYRTMDNMAAFNRSVNLVVNIANLGEIGQILKQGVAENRAFYHVFQETLQKMGKS